MFPHADILFHYTENRAETRVNSPGHGGPSSEDALACVQGTEKAACAQHLWPAARRRLSYLLVPDL